MSLFLRVPLVLGWLVVLPMAAGAQTIQSIDTAPNDQFSDRVMVDPGITHIFGQLDSPDMPEPIYTTNETLNRGEVDTFTISDLPPSEPFFVWLDHGTSSMDTILGVFDSTDNMVAFDDDGSPTGNLASAIRGVVPSTGTLRLKVSGIGDDDFDGAHEYYHDEHSESPMSEPHYQQGDYTLSAVIGDVEIVSDVDFFTLSGLTPGDAFTISEALSASGVSMQWLANDGTVISHSSFSETDNREQISGLVPNSGQVHVVVRGYNAYGYEGGYISTGEYLLRVESRTVDAQ